VGSEMCIRDSLYVWDLSFLIWGVLLGVATWHFSRGASDTEELDV